MTIIDYTDSLKMFDIVEYDSNMYQITGYDDIHCFLTKIEWDDSIVPVNVDWNYMNII